MESPVCGAPVGWNGVPNARAEGPADQRQPPESGWPALNTVLSERWFGQARFTQRLERDFVLQHEGRSAAPSARSGGLDDVDGSPDGRVYIQMRRIEQVRVRSGPKGGHGPGGVAGVAFQDIAQNDGLIRVPAPSLKLPEPAAGAFFGRRGNEN